MNKLLQMLMVVAIALVSFSTASSVLAQESDCTITNTGPDSTNECIQKDEYTCKITNDNKIEIYDENDQIVASGDAEVEDNTSGGGATTGRAINSNNVTYNVRIENGECEVENVVKPPVTPSENGQGAGGGAGQVEAPSEAVPVALPVTDSDTFINSFGSLAGILGSGVVGFYIFKFAYGRLN